MAWLGKDFIMWSLVLTSVWQFFPFVVVTFLARLQTIPPELYEAAKVDGATAWRRFLHVTLPLTMPGIVAAALLTFIPALGDFVTPDLLGGPGTTTIAKNIQELFLAGRDWPYGAALGFVLMVVTLTGTLLALRTLRREVVGAD